MDAFRTLLLPLAIGLAAAALFSIRLGIEPEFDELYHLLAARSYLETGQLAIAEGIYDRGAAFTILVSSMLKAFGDRVEIARLPSLISYGPSAEMGHGFPVTQKSIGQAWPGLRGKKPWSSSGR